jgi:integrase
VLQRVRVILDHAAKSEGEPSRFNPALAIRLPKRQAHEQVKHHAAVPYADVPALMDKLRAKKVTSAMLLRFIILTAARSGEARAATWDEIDLDEALWQLPAERMKAGKPHVVPLVPEAVEILKEMAERKNSRAPQLVFPSDTGKVLSDTAVAKQVRWVAEAHATPHGFRSSFRDFAAEETHHPAWVAEAALAHTVADKVEAAYRRGDLLKKRRALMETWANYIRNSDNVISLVANKSA